MTRHPGSLRLRVAALVVAALALLLSGAGPAAAGPDWNKVQWRRLAGGCGAGLTHINPTGSVRLYEFGKSGVTGFEAKYRLYNDETIGWNWNPLDKTYRSSSIPDDYQSYSVRLPGTGVHQFSQVRAVSPHRLDVRLKWERAWRRDWVWQWTILRCAAASP